MHEHPWTTWSWDLSIDKGMREKDDVYEAKGNVRRIQTSRKFAQKDSGFISNSECVIEELRGWCSQGSCKTRAHSKRFVLSVLKGLKNETDSAKVIITRRSCWMCLIP